MKLHRHTSDENNEMRTSKWPQFVPDNVEHDDIYVMNEFICIHCRNSLRQKKTKDVPQDLQNILPLERRGISPPIPFKTILVTRQYGVHYKVNGPPVNVPATLDQIIEILSHMPSELQLILRN